MKNTVLILLILISISCSQNNRRDQSLTIALPTSHNFDWLEGSWIRSNDEEGNSTYEYWMKNSATEYTGLGCTLRGVDTIFKEGLRLIKSGEEWSLEVTGVNEDPTLFLIINHTDSSFECENKVNEFPKLIEYSVHKDILLAKISDEETEISFSFTKLPLK